MAQPLLTDPGFFYSCIGLAGLIIGSFLNVVIVRLPRMLESGYCPGTAETPGPPPDQQVATTYNLFWPRSACPNCHACIRVRHNIPVLGFALLRGHCAECGCRISWQYPLIEIGTTAASVVVGWHFGPTIACVPALMLTWGLMALAAIDWRTQLLPDDITLPLLWLGLLSNAEHLFVDPASAILGASAGYIALWLAFHLFRLATGKKGMGYGDFKLMAVLGAWLGWQSLPLMLLLASTAGALSGILLITCGRLERGHAIPFGPFLAAAGWLMLVSGDTMIQTYLSLIGSI